LTSSSARKAGVSSRDYVSTMSDGLFYLLSFASGALVLGWLLFVMLAG
jgi:hypothetical protein